MPREIASYADVRGFDPAVRQHSLMGIGHEVISRAILPLLLFRVGQLSITGQKMTLITGLSLRYNAPVIVTTATAPTGLGNSRDIDFLLCKALVYVQQCGDYGQSLAQISAGNSEISPASLGMKPKAALFHFTAGTMLRSKHGT